MQLFSIRGKCRENTRDLDGEKKNKTEREREQMFLFFPHLHLAANVQQVVLRLRDHRALFWVCRWCFCTDQLMKSAFKAGEGSHVNVKFYRHFATCQKPLKPHNLREAMST